MTMIKAPYNFVPLSNWIFSPSWADQASQDIPFADGVSGSLSVTLTTHSPLLVGGKITPADDISKAPQQVEFAHDPVSGVPLIPGSSLKGMLRSVIEIAAFGKMARINDRRYGVRDLATKNFYSRRMGIPKAGFLRFEQGKWVLTPCQWAKIKQRDYVSWAGISEENWLKGGESSAIHRYALLNKVKKLHSQAGYYPKQLTVKTEIDPDAYPVDGKKTLRAQIVPGGKPAFLVVTGQPTTKGAKNFDKLKELKAKQNDFVFFDVESNALSVSERVIQDFLFINDTRNPQNKEPTWEFWQNKISNKPGIPVFWKEDADGQVESMGLSSMYRLAYKLSVHDALGNTSSGHQDMRIMDLAETMFGRVDELDSVRGRINITSARATRYEYGKSVNTVLGSPKSTYYPNYLIQNPGNREYVTMFDDGAMLRGWKRYPIRDNTEGPVLDSDIGYKVRVDLKPVSKGADFSFRIHFHNLKPEELGALLWACEWGGDRELRHSLGMGKSLGFGACSLQAKVEHIVANDPDNTCKTAEDYRTDFINLMTSSIANTESSAPTFDETLQIKSLKAMARTGAVDVGWMVLKDFSEARKKTNNALANVEKGKENWLSTASVTNEQGDVVAAVIAGSGSAALAALEKQQKVAAEKAEYEALSDGIRMMQEKARWVLNLKKKEVGPGDGRYSELLDIMMNPPGELSSESELKAVANLAWLLCHDRCDKTWASKSKKDLGKQRKARAEELMAGSPMTEDELREYFKL